MANMLNFKFGQFGSLPSTKSAGTVYVTTDEQAMYIDLPKSHEANAELTRVRIGDIIVKESSRDAIPPFSEGAFYYFVAENALLRWHNGDWKQINSVADVQASIKTLDEKVDAEIERSTAKDSAHDQSISDLNTAVGQRLTTADFNTFKTENTAAIADAKKAGTDAAAAAATADGKAVAAQNTADSALTEAGKKLDKTGGTMSGPIAMGSNKITGLATPENNTDAATKKYVDDAKTAALNAAEAASTAAGAAQSKADSAYTAAGNAQNTADSALEKANDAYGLAETKITLKEVQDLNYATKSEAKGYADAVLGTEQDTATSVTVRGAIKKAEAAAADALRAQQTADGKTTMSEVEAKGYATKTEAQAMADAVLGKSGDSETKNTVYGAHAAAAAAKSQADKGVLDAAKASAAAAAAQGTADSAVDAAQAADAKAVAAGTAAAEAKDAATAANNNANTRVLTTDFEAFKTANTAAIGAVDAKAGAAQTTADAAVRDAAAAQAQADKGVADAAAALAQANKMLPLTGGTMTGAINMGSKKITNLATPTNNADAATKKYVDDAKAAAIAEADAAQSTADSALAKANAALPMDGTGTMTGALNMGGKQITNMAAPTADAHATTKKYVDDAIAAGIKANDAMTFKGTVGGNGATVSALPTTAQKGDTYKVAAKGKYANIEAKVGDLFINVANDDATASWTHISSGYEDDYLQKLVVNQNTIHLTDGVTNSSTGSVGGFTIVGASNSNLVFEVTTGSGDNPVHTITASMTWGTF